MAGNIAGFAASENALCWYSACISLLKSTNEDEIILALGVGGRPQQGAPKKISKRCMICGNNPEAQIRFDPDQKPYSKRKKSFARTEYQTSSCHAALTLPSCLFNTLVTELRSSETPNPNPNPN